MPLLKGCLICWYFATPCVANFTPLVRRFKPTSLCFWQSVPSRCYSLFTVHSAFGFKQTSLSAVPSSLKLFGHPAVCMCHCSGVFDALVFGCGPNLRIAALTVTSATKANTLHCEGDLLQELRCGGYLLWGVFAAKVFLHVINRVVSLLTVSSAYCEVSNSSRLTVVCCFEPCSAGLSPPSTQKFTAGLPLACN